MAVKTTPSTPSREATTLSPENEEVIKKFVENTRN